MIFFFNSSAIDIASSIQVCNKILVNLKFDIKINFSKYLLSWRYVIKFKPRFDHACKDEYHKITIINFE